LYSGANVHETRSGNIKYSQHAEMSALQKYVKSEYGKTATLATPNKKMRGKPPTIYVVRLVKYQSHDEKSCMFGNSLPCCDCQANLKKFGIKSIKYTNFINDIPVLCEMRLN